MKSGNEHRSGKNHPRYLDLDGQRFGKLIVLDSYLPNRMTLVRCDCGKEFEVYKSSITSGHTTSCGKGLCHSATKDLTGQQFGYLTVVRFLEGKTTHGYGTLWECLCVCGKTHNVVSHSLITGQTKSCGCKTGLMYSELATLPGCASSIHSIFCGYKKHAQKLKVKFKLSKEEFEKLIQTPCHYCGAELSNIRKLKNLTGATEYRYNGIDRIDSNSDYCLENCVAACKDCNYAKRKLTYDKFLSLARRITTRHSTKVQHEYQSKILI
ncbi:MAG: hypothetical protein ACREBJ_00955 [Nitrosotalea sp.]